MLNRRRFLQSIIAAAASPAALQGCNSTAVKPSQSSGLPADPGRYLNLVRGLEYQVISRRGERMSDGLRVPGSHDGMAAFPGENGRIILVFASQKRSFGGRVREARDLRRERARIDH